jgi:hypothetical protein
MFVTLVCVGTTGIIFGPTAVCWSGKLGSISNQSTSLHRETTSKTTSSSAAGSDAGTSVGNKKVVLVS